MVTGGQAFCMQQNSVRVAVRVRRAQEHAVAIRMPRGGGVKKVENGKWKSGKWNGGTGRKMLTSDNYSHTA